MSHDNLYTNGNVTNEKKKKHNEQHTKSYLQSKIHPISIIIYLAGSYNYHLVQ